MSRRAEYWLEKALRDAEANGELATAGGDRKSEDFKSHNVQLEKKPSRSTYLPDWQVGASGLYAPRAIADDFMNTEPANDSLPGEHGKPPYPGYSLGEYHSVVRMTRIPHRSVERTRTGRMKHHSAVAFNHLRPRPVRVDMLRSSINQAPVVVQFPALDRLECAHLEELGIQYPRLRARLVGMAPTPLVRALARTERCGSRLRFEICVTVSASRLSFDTVDGTELTKLPIMLTAQAFSGDYIEAAVGRTQSGFIHL